MQISQLYADQKIFIHAINCNSTSSYEVKVYTSTFP